MNVTISKARHEELNKLKKPLLVVGETDKKVYLVVDSDRVRKFRNGEADADLSRLFVGKVVLSLSEVSLTVV